jgi:hypothetical protein
MLLILPPEKGWDLGKEATKGAKGASGINFSKTECKYLTG